MTGAASAYYDGIATSYDAQVDTAYNRAVRECFWRCAQSVLRPSSRILDFGAGTGIDAEHFATLGHFVAACDYSHGMLQVLRRRCATLIGDGRVVPVVGELGEAAAVLEELAPFDAILSNFAVFSTIHDLQPVLALFSKLLRPGGLLLILVQNPWDRQQIKTGAFWKSLLASPFRGALRYVSPDQGEVWHRTPAQIARAARQDFAPTARTRVAGRACFGAGSHFKLVELSRR